MEAVELLWMAVPQSKCHHGDTTAPLSGEGVGAFKWEMLLVEVARGRCDCLMAWPSSLSLILCIFSPGLAVLYPYKDIISSIGKAKFSIHVLLRRVQPQA